MEWYKLTDLWGEARALPRVAFGTTQVLHYLDADTTAFLLPQLKGLGVINTKVVASYHQPPEVLARIVPERVLRCLDRVIVVSSEQAEHFTRIIGSDRVRLILLGIDTEFFCPATTPRRPGPIRCLTVGFWLRDFNVLGEVAEQLEHRHDIEFHIVAPETDGLTGGGNVTIHRGVTDDHLRELYQEADILFLPLLAATANNALLEGMASALPVISTRLPAVESYLDGAEAILIDRNEPAAFVSAICSLAHDAARRQRMARSSRKRAEQLDWRRIAKQYEDVYAD
jgi:glycosyltransferase involved in cell wall biosynthesis